MVTILNDSDRKNFLKLLKSVVFGDVEKCSSLLISLSKYEHNFVGSEEYKKFRYDLDVLFDNISDVPLSDIDTGMVLKNLLDIVRKHKMRLEGHFATVLTNLLVLESLAKGLDPDCNVVGAATPFLLNKSIELLTS